MGFAETLNKYADFDFEGFFARVSDADVSRAIESDRLGPSDYLALLSPRAEAHLEAMARKAQSVTIRHFGRAMLLFTPIYISNHCVNSCLYCGFNHRNEIPRKQLTIEELTAEADVIAATGLKHVLVLTGESRADTPVSYIRDCIGVLKKRFTSIGVEILPLAEGEYREIVEAGADGLTIYQETYDRAVYERLHPSGPKRDFDWRLEAPERACRAGMRSVNIGALLGLADWRKDAFLAGLHADRLQRDFSDVEVSVSPPRVRPQTGGFAPPVAVTDKSLVQYVAALRMFMPRCGVTLSTRESARFRDNMVGLGITKMSGGVSAAVGGRTSPHEVGQFDVADGRSVAEVARALYEKGYQPVYKDWQAL